VWVHLYRGDREKPVTRLSSACLKAKLWLISNEGIKTLTGFFATFYARGIFGNSALQKLALVLSANFRGLLRPVHSHLFRHQMITYLTWDLSDTQIQPDLCHESKKSPMGALSEA
jgi:hypothetical protein